MVICLRNTLAIVTFLRKLSVREVYDRDGYDVYDRDEYGPPRAEPAGNHTPREPSAHRGPQNEGLRRVGIALSG